MPSVIQSATMMMMDMMHMTYYDRATVLERQPFIKDGTMQATFDISENIDWVSAPLTEQPKGIHAY